LTSVSYRALNDEVGGRGIVGSSKDGSGEGLLECGKGDGVANQRKWHAHRSGESVTEKTRSQSLQGAQCRTTQEEERRKERERKKERKKEMKRKEKEKEKERKEKEKERKEKINEIEERKEEEKEEKKQGEEKGLTLFHFMAQAEPRVDRLSIARRTG